MKDSTKLIFIAVLAALYWYGIKYEPIDRYFYPERFVPLQIHECWEGPPRSVFEPSKGDHPKDCQPTRKAK